MPARSKARKRALDLLYAAELRGVPATQLLDEAPLAEGAGRAAPTRNPYVATHEGNPLFIELPASVELEVTYTEPGLQGDRSTGGTKPATLETGKLIQVPLFITTGERIKVDTRDGSYQGRVN